MFPTCLMRWHYCPMAFLVAARQPGPAFTPLGKRDGAWQLMDCKPVFASIRGAFCIFPMLV